MQQSDSTETMRCSQDFERQYDQSVDNPERMLFYATVFGVMSWAIIGLISWGVSNWLQ